MYSLDDLLNPTVRTINRLKLELSDHNPRNSDQYYTFIYACKHGRMDCIPALHDRLQETTENEYYRYHTIHLGISEAGANGHLDVLQYFPDNQWRKFSLARWGHLHLVKHYRDQINPDELDLMCKSAGEGEHWDIFEYLLGMISQWDNEYIPMHETFIYLCKNQHAEALRKLVSVPQFRVPPDAFMLVVGYGLLDIAEELRSTTNPDVASGYEQAMGRIGQRGDVSALQYLLNLHPYDLHYRHDELIREVARHGQVEMMKYLISLESKYGKFDVRAGTDGPFRFACANGHLQMVQYLMSLDRGINIRRSNGYALNYACKNGHVHVVDYLIQTGKELKNKWNLTKPFWDPLWVNRAFHEAWGKDHLPIIKYLVNSGLVNLDSFSYRSMFKIAGEKGYLSLLKYFMSMYPDDIDNVAVQESFNRAFKGGHVPVMEYWLSTSLNHPINISRLGEIRVYYNNRASLAAYRLIIGDDPSKITEADRQELIQLNFDVELYDRHFGTLRHRAFEAVRNQGLKPTDGSAFPYDIRIWQDWFQMYHS